jgi:hypothetical protein
VSRVLPSGCEVVCEVSTEQIWNSSLGSQGSAFMLFDEGDDFGGEGFGFAGVVVEVYQDGGDVGYDVIGLGVAELVFEGPGLGTDAGGAGVDVEGLAVEDGDEEVNFGAGDGHVEVAGVGDAGEVAIVGDASGFGVGEVGGVVDVDEHVDVAEADFGGVAEVPAGVWWWG